MGDCSLCKNKNSNSDQFVSDFSVRCTHVRRTLSSGTTKLSKASFEISLEIKHARSATPNITAGNDFFKCLSKASGAVTRGSNLKISRVIKITTMGDVELTIFQAQLNQYYFKMSIDVNDEDALMTYVLKEESTVMIVCATNNVCISFQ